MLGNLACQRVNTADTVNLVTEELDADCAVTLGGRKNLNCVATDTEFVTDKVDVISLVADRNQAANKLLTAHFLTDTDRDQKALILHGVTERINTGNRGNDNNVTALKQSAGGTMAEHIDLLVYHSVLFNINVLAGDIGLRLVVIVVGNEVFHRILGEKCTQLCAELGGEGLVVSKNQGGSIQVGNNVCHSKGFTRTGNTEKCLRPLACENALCQSLDRLWLIARRLVIADKLKLFVKHILPSFPKPPAVLTLP